MLSGVYGPQAEGARQMLATLGYDNPSSEDIALTLQQMGEARALRTQHVSTQRGTPDQTGVSPPRGAYDTTMSPRNSGQSPVGRGGVLKGTTATPDDVRHVRAKPPPVDFRDCFDYRMHERAPGRVSVGGILKRGGGERSNRRYVDPVDGPIAGTVGKDPWGRLRFVSTGDRITPEDRIEQHLRQHEKGLSAPLGGRRTSETREYPARKGRRNNVSRGQDEEDEYSDYVDDYYDDEGFGGNLEMFYGGRPPTAVTPSMTLRLGNKFALDQRSANTMYNFTGDSRYKYRSGPGAPLSTVLGPNGSTLRNRADPVRRGQEMRELWKKDSFLAQHGRKEDRWRVRQTMLSRSLQ
ncbi:hypothetical protein, conserved [Trypanosoma brucei brucei TREU927]|uniref:Uncharacterized protein n=1 Tax=Trypanosoma brucei brucei (strain 927/4 GUTat10.1) TaxID=185431 RepID=Q38F71_TRYB2|nr:hypothetical protein, conserved [Trypanosoma brucei brucei TREU927]EAN76549.1 hypothetical protein, conserved [Trypanosoma brucei brucei TREU927]